jgi:CopG family transcriptional regulator/antitoxin EndoAI
MRASRTVTISLPPELADDVDQLAASERRTRSELLREAFRQYVSTRKRWDSIFAYGQPKAGQVGLTSEGSVADAVKKYRRRRAQRH